MVLAVPAEMNVYSPPNDIQKSRSCGLVAVQTVCELYGVHVSLMDVARQLDLNAIRLREKDLLVDLGSCGKALNQRGIPAKQVLLSSHLSVPELTAAICALRTSETTHHAVVVVRTCDDVFIIDGAHIFLADSSEFNQIISRPAIVVCNPLPGAVLSFQN